MGRLRQLLSLFSRGSDGEQSAAALSPIQDAPPTTAEPQSLELVPWTTEQLIKIFEQLNRKPDDTSLAAARAARECLSRFWLAAPLDQLEILYAGGIGRAQRDLLTSILPLLPLDADEELWKATLTEYLLASFERHESINVLLALLPYYDRAGICVADPLNQIPGWFLADYAERCDPALAVQLRQRQQLQQPDLPDSGVPIGAVGALSPPPLLPDLAPLQGDAAMALIRDSAFLGRVGGLITLYGIDPSDSELQQELADARRQVAQVWLDVETDQIEPLYRTAFGQLTANLIASGFAREPISPEEESVRLQLGDVLRKLEHPRSLNAFMAAMLYVPVSAVSLGRTATSRLPDWLIVELEQWRSCSPI